MTNYWRYFPYGPVSGDYPFEDNGKHFILDRAFRYIDSIDGEPFAVTIPAGFETDFNSTPRIVWSWFPPQECPEAALVHDWLYQHPGGLSRGFVDRVHRRVMELKGERATKRLAAWLGIRAGGRFAWNRYRQAERRTQSASHRP